MNIHTNLSMIISDVRITKMSKFIMMLFGLY